jgi:flagellar basal-body rod protein FlgG
MLKALSTAATGLEAQQAGIDNIANDIANVNTDGYKRSSTEFHDLMYENIRDPGATNEGKTASPVGVQKGLGVKVGASHKIHEQGSGRVTNNPYDLMIEGKGFLQIERPNGEIQYTRTGAFKLDSQGRVSLSDGSRLVPEITVPPNAVGVVIGDNGEVKAMIPGEGDTTIGQIQIATFVNEQGLKAMGGNYYTRTPGSGAPTVIVPGEAGAGTLMQGALESSNVNIGNSMVEMIRAQRGFETNTRVMSVADKMLEATVNIVR